MRNKTKLFLAYLACASALSTGFPQSAVAAGIGLKSSCTVVNPNRFQCNFPAQAAATQIQYASMQCGSLGSSTFSLQEFQVLTTPQNASSEIAYQIPITNRTSLGGVVNTGSPVTIYVKPAQSFRALIDVTPAPNGKTQCTVSLSGQ
jgi:hypothetical protein